MNLRLLTEIQNLLRGRKSVRTVTLSATALLLVSILLLGWELFSLNSQLKSRISGEWFLPPVIVYAQPVSVFPGDRLELTLLQSQLTARGVRERSPDQPLRNNDFSIWDSASCQAHVAEAIHDERCLVWKDALGLLHMLTFDQMGETIRSLFHKEPLQRTDSLSLPPPIFATLIDGKPILQNRVGLGDVPLQCLQAVTAIEDRNFLEHKGFQITGILRALWVNFFSGRTAQGGSTITQQLVKNYFLSPERTFKRKVKELLISMLIESHLSKDQILENYLNVIYMGQNGPYQVRGYGSASQFYFHKNLKDLELPECALLAAILNCPGCYNPWTKPAPALQRRSLVLTKMQESNHISEETRSLAERKPLPPKPEKGFVDPAPYYLDAVQKFLSAQGIDPHEGLAVYTGLDPKIQSLAQTQAFAQVVDLEKKSKLLSALRDQGKHLETAAVIVNLRTSSVSAIVGGKSFKASQFNRALEAKRQVGSILKPVVFLAALENRTMDPPFSPLRILEDAPKQYRYQGQKWSPSNYDRKFRGPIPAYYALKESLNVPTAALGMEVGLTNVIELAKRLGIRSRIDPVPSLTLGAFETTLIEVAQAYSTLAHLGTYRELQVVTRVENFNAQTLYVAPSNGEFRIDPDAVAQLLGMMIETMKSGTAKGVSAAGFTMPSAGKTGTTSDYKDAWFVGFTPYYLTLVWFGYDDNTPHQLTGGSAGVPLWTRLMTEIHQGLPRRDFILPPTVESRLVDPLKLENFIWDPNTLGIPVQVELILNKESSFP